MRSRHRRARSARTSLLVMVVLAISALLGGASADAATKTPFDTNLVKNPGAEAGAGTNGNASVQIPNWKARDNFTVVRYGAPGFLTKAESQRIGGGKKFFSCGPNTYDGYGLQTIRPRGRATLINNQHVKVIVKARLAGYASQQDSARVHVEFYRDEVAYDYVETPAVAASDGVFITKSASKMMPAGTTSMGVFLMGERANNGGTYCDAYFDNISLVLKLV